MARRLRKVPITVYVPAVYPQAGRAAYCETTRRLVGYTSPGGVTPVGNTGGGQLVYTPPDPLNPLSPGTWGLVPNLGPFGTPTSVGVPRDSVLRPRYVYTETCYTEIPAREGAPARVTTNSGTGWNAGAISFRPVPAFGYVRGRMLPTLVATQFGLADVYFNYSYGYMPHSFVCRLGEWAVVESGVTKANGALPDRALLEIQRRGGIVAYRVNGSDVHTSEVPSSGTVYAASLLYSIGDGVDDAAIGTLGQTIRFSDQTPSARFVGSDVADFASMVGAAPSIVLEATAEPVFGVLRFFGALPIARAIGSDRHVVTMRAAAPAYRLRSEASKPERQLTQMVAVLPPLAMQALVQSGTSTRLSADLPKPLFVGADIGDLAIMRGEAPLSLLLTAYEPYMPAGEIDGMDSLVAFDVSSLESALVLVAMDSLELGSSAELLIITQLVGMDSLRFADTASLGQLVEMLAIERVAINSSTATAKKEAIQYAVNIATGALSVYQGFDFQGFAHVGQDTYGWKPDGLYRIGAELDDGELIQALVDFGTSDFGSSFVKRAEYAYLGVRTDGQCYLRVVMDEGTERVYRVRGNDNMRRAQMARGVSGRQLSLQLEVADASFVEVDCLELVIGATQRRGFGARN